jgi:antitoxin ParD1/3/4/toxin ParE1/3/4
LAPEAKDDLRGIRDYLADAGGQRLARYVLGEFSAAFQLLASRPEAGHVRQDLTSLSVKFWPVFSYLIVYDPVARPLAVVRVLHGRRDVRAIMARGRTDDPAP